MGCGGCNQRRIELTLAVRDLASGELQAMATKLGNVGRSLSDDTAALTRAAGQRLSAAHARLKR